MKEANGSQLSSSNTAGIEMHQNLLSNDYYTISRSEALSPDAKNSKKRRALKSEISYSNTSNFNNQQSSLTLIYSQNWHPPSSTSISAKQNSRSATSYFTPSGAVSNTTSTPLNTISHQDKIAKTKVETITERASIQTQTEEEVQINNSKRRLIRILLCCFTPSEINFTTSEITAAQHDHSYG